MEKKHISILGSCVSRNLFNNEFIKEYFEVDRYAYHICPWDLFGQPLGLPEDQISKYIKEEFTARMVNYDLNKITIKEFEKCQSEYLLIDFYSFAAAPIEKIKYNEVFCYSQNTCFRYYNFKNSSNKILNIEIVEKNTLNDYIKHGLNKFAQWIKVNFELKKVIIFVPTFAENYITNENCITKYEDYNTAKALLAYIKKVSYEFCEMLDNKAKILDLSEMEAIATFGVYDDVSRLQVPPKMHLTNLNYIQQSKKLLDLLELEYNIQIYNKLVTEEKSIMQNLKIGIDDNVSNDSGVLVGKNDNLAKNKKHISIIGSCVSRSLFNTRILSNIFQVDCYAFQRVVWDICNDGFNLSDELMDNLPVENFTARMLNYSINKTILSDFEKAHSEYLMIDLHNFFARLYKLSYKDKVCYFQNTTYNDKKAIESFGMSPFNEMKFEEVLSHSEDQVVNGLKAFASWVKSLYSEENVIIYISKAAKKYFCNGVINYYSDKKIEEDKFYDSLVEKYSILLKEFIPKAKVLLDVGNKIATFEITDDINILFKPPSEHYSIPDQIDQSKAMLKLLNIEFSSVDIYSMELLNLKNDLVNTNYQLIQNTKLILNLNTYWNRIADLNDVVVVLSVKDESSKMLKYFRNRNILGINAKFDFRNSYIAIIDKSRNYVYERASKDELVFEYCISGHKIHITSAGFDAGNRSSIVINNIEYSKDHRGLNIVVLDAKSAKVLDSAYCDTFADKDLKVFSSFFDNIKIKAE